MTPNIEIAFAEHVSDLLKQAADAAPSAGEKYLPWYGAAGLGTAGHEIGKRLLPGRAKAFGAVAGTLAGTAAGVHGGEALGKAIDKRAEVEHQPLQEPNYNQTLRNIAKRQAGVTAKEIGAVTLPLAAGVGAGLGYEKYMKSRGATAGPAARKIMAFSALPAVGLTAAAAYQAARRLKENEFVRIQQEEQDKHEQAMKEYQGSLQRRPQPEGLS